MIWREVHVNEKVELSADSFDWGQRLFEVGVLQMAFSKFEDQGLASEVTTVRIQRGWAGHCWNKLTD